MATVQEPGSLEWWLARLDRRLVDRQRPMRELDDYYTGAQPLHAASAKFTAAFGDRFPHVAANFMELIVDAHRERLHVQGVRIGDGREGDRDAWDWWQRNRLDAGSQVLHTECLVTGVAYAMVWPDGDEPVATIESPLQVVVETDPAMPWRRRAGYKRYVGEDLRWHAELYLPDGSPGPDDKAAVYKFRTRTRAGAVDTASPVTMSRWEREDDLGEPWPIPVKIGVVPIVPFVNRPRLGPSDRARERRDGRSEIAGVLSSQDMIDLLRAGAAVGAEFGAFRQKFMIGVDIPVDPLTGKPFTDVKAAIQYLWLLQPSDPDNEHQRPQVGSFDVSPLDPYFGGIKSEMQTMASITRTPTHYFLQQSGQPPSGESLRSAEVGLVAKVRDSQLHKGDGWEELIRLQYAWRGDARAGDTSYELIWRDPEYRTEAEHTDALVKQRQSLEIPLEVTWEKLGYSPHEIRRMKTMRAEEALLEALRPPPVATVTLGPGQAPQQLAQPAQPPLLSAGDNGTS